MDLGDILTRLDMTVQTLNRSVQVLESMQRETEKRVSRLEVDVGILKGQVDEKNN